MILSHMNALEKVLIAQSEIARNAGHPNLRGGPREWFIRDFLQNHLPTSLEIGQGEIIDEDSKPHPPRDGYRNQVDVIIYRRDMPRITYAFDNAAFLAEGVVASLEIKSILTKETLYSGCKAAKNHKSMRRSPLLHCFGANPPEAILCYMVSYECGNNSISEVASWLPEIAKNLQVNADKLMDVIVVLGKGIIFQGKAISALPGFQGLDESNQWIYFNQADKNLFMLFVHMLTWISFISSPPSALGYVSLLDFEKYETI